MDKNLGGLAMATAQMTNRLRRWVGGRARSWAETKHWLDQRHCRHLVLCRAVGSVGMTGVGWIILWAGKRVMWGG
jgi:uncharacterized membrane protein YoaK (UPF0700 family)